MHWKRGFRRITLVCAIVVAVCGGIIGFLIVMDEQYYAEENLRQAQKDFKEKYGGIYLKLVDDDTGKVVKRTIDIAKLRKKYPYYDDLSDAEFEQKMLNRISSLEQELLKRISKDEARIKELKTRAVFLPALGKALFVGVCTAGFAYAGIWFVYWLLEWIILGFVGNKPKGKENEGEKQ